MYSNETLLLTIAHQKLDEMHRESAHEAMVKEAKRKRFNWFVRLNETTPKSVREANAEWAEAARSATLRSI